MVGSLTMSDQRGEYKVNKCHRCGPVTGKNIIFRIKPTRQFIFSASVAATTLYEKDKNASMAWIEI